MSNQLKKGENKQMLKKGSLVKIKKVELHDGIDKKYLDENLFTVEGLDNGKVIVKTLDGDYLINFRAEELINEDGSEVKVNEHVLLKDLQLIDNEVDIRSLTLKDYRQLMWRCELQKQGYMKQTVMIQNETNLIMREIAKKLGIDNIEDLIDGWRMPERNN